MSAELWGDRGYVKTKAAGTGARGRRVAGLMVLIFGGRICVGDEEDGFGYDEGYDYDDFGVALDCFDGWDPETEAEPTGWVRHTPSYRRRPAGNPDREYVDAPTDRELGAAVTDPGDDDNESGWR